MQKLCVLERLFKLKVTLILPLDEIENNRDFLSFEDPNKTLEIALKIFNLENV